MGMMIDRWLAWLIGASMWPLSSWALGVNSGTSKVSEPVMRDNSQRMCGLPANWFSSHDLAAEQVRLLFKRDLGFGQSLSRGECFHVQGFELGPGRRFLLLSNHRAHCVPVPDYDCELLIFDRSAERNPDGQQSQ